MTEEIFIKLPFPPSLNTCYRAHYFKKQERIGQLLSKRGRGWRNDVLKSYPRYKNTIKKEVEVIIKLYPPTNHKRDVDNYAKAILDVLEKLEYFVNDQQVRKLTIERMKELNNHALVQILF